MNQLKSPENTPYRKVHVTTALQKASSKLSLKASGNYYFEGDFMFSTAVVQKRTPTRVEKLKFSSAGKVYEYTCESIEKTVCCASIGHLTKPLTDTFLARCDIMYDLPMRYLGNLEVGDSFCIPSFMGGSGLSECEVLSDELPGIKVIVNLSTYKETTFADHLIVKKLN